MKRLVWAVLTVVTAAVMIAYSGHVIRGSDSSAEPRITADLSETIEAAGAATPVHASAGQIKPLHPRGNTITDQTEAPQSPQTSAPVPLRFDDAMATLLSPQATHAQRQAAWKQLIAAGRLDDAIADLEQRVSADPRAVDCLAALGQGYLKKCGTIQDIRDQGILAMQADKLFDRALGLDPANWEARFTKAVAMSYWPANLNKGEEVIQHFQTLIQQQEQQPPQPQFAESYVWLGDQYQKAGQADAARSVWERGAAFFPNQATLQKRLAPASSAPVAAAH